MIALVGGIFVGGSLVGIRVAVLVGNGVGEAVSVSVGEGVNVSVMVGVDDKTTTAVGELTVGLEITGVEVYGMGVVFGEGWLVGVMPAEFTGK